MYKILSILKNSFIVRTLTSPEFVKRFKSLLWTSGTMLLAAMLDLIAQTFTQVNPDNIITICIGLIFAQITKHLNK